VEAVCTVHQPGGIVALVVNYMDRCHELFIFWYEMNACRLTIILFIEIKFDI